MTTLGVVAGRILRVRPHPNASYIYLAIVDVGKDREPLQIVFGGRRRLSAGDMVTVALPGARLPGVRKMRRRRYRGEYCSGMLCSLKELGWSDGEADEVAVIDNSFTPGISLAEIRDPLRIVITPPMTTE